jgi:hypothetical protein
MLAQIFTVLDPRWTAPPGMDRSRRIGHYPLAAVVHGVVASSSSTIRDAADAGSFNEGRGG